MSQTMNATAGEAPREATLAEVLGTLDELAAAARTDDGDRYRAALRAAERQAITGEQVSDAYRWGRRAAGAARFDDRGVDPRTYDWSEGSRELAGVCWCGDHSCLGDPCVNQE